MNMLTLDEIFITSPILANKRMKPYIENILETHEDGFRPNYHGLFFSVKANSRTIIRSKVTIYLSILRMHMI